MVKNNFIWQKNNQQHLFAIVGHFLVGKYDDNCQLPLLIKRVACKYEYCYVFLLTHVTVF